MDNADSWAAAPIQADIAKKRDYLLAAIKRGIAKVNVGTEIRQVYEAALRESGSVATAQESVYDHTCWSIHDYFALTGTREFVAE